MSPPSAFGTFRVLHQIGSGVLGPVFRAYDSQQDRLVAIKTFKLDLVPEAASRFADRLRALAATRPAHPAIVGAVDAGLAGATPFVALEYASGEPLDAVLRQSGAWPTARALPVLREIAAAIDASWGAAVGHGALHPRDIFVEVGSPDLRVTGFGISQALEDTDAKAPVRRPYSAPERADGAPLDIFADVYSLGVVAFEMLSGQRPIGPDDEGGTAAVELPADARAAVRRVLAVAMADLPGDRYETATAFVDALAGAARPAEAPSPAAPTEPAAASASLESVPGSADPPRRQGRVRRPRPVALGLPLLDGAEADIESAPPAAEPEQSPEPEAPDAPHQPPEDAEAAEPESPIEPEPVIPPAPVAEADPVPAFLSAVVPAPVPVPVSISDPGPADEIRFVDVPGQSDEPARPGPQVDFGRAALREDDEVEMPAAAFPWMAVVAVFVAGLVLGGVLMYQLGWRRGSAAATLAAAAAAPAATPAPAVVVPEAAPPPVEAPIPAAAAAARRTPSPRPSASPEAAPGRLVIQSVPAGALVTIDGRHAGETPVTVSVPLGRHEIQIARPGYVPYNERVELTKKSSSRTLRVQLKRGGDPAAVGRR